jgi:hypothetical protein
MLVAGIATAVGQGTITFDAHPYFGGTNYTELGMNFHVVFPTPPGTDYDGMGIVPGNFANNLPYNNSPYMIFAALVNPNVYVSFNLTNGYSFGLTSVQLADPNSPSLSPVSISFIGSLGDGSTVTNTFVTPGGGATTFLDYSFNSDFASGLTSVKIDAPRWAMDNLVFTVPEPSAVSLVLLGGGVFGYVRTRKKIRLGNRGK